MRNGVLHVKLNSATGKGFKSVKPKDTIARERHEARMSCVTKDSVNQIMSDLPAAFWIDRFVRSESFKEFALVS